MARVHGHGRIVEQGTHDVGPSLSLAPTAMAFVTLILLPATVRHPALGES